jgi:hypothetical protein
MNQRLAPLPGEHSSDRYSTLRMTLRTDHPIDFIVCDDCGVIVSDTEKHENHHGQLDAVAFMLDQLGTRTYGADWGKGTPPAPDPT